MTIGERIKSVRLDNSLKQAEFAERLGIGQTHVSKIEKNRENPSETLIRFISYMFGVSYEWLKDGVGSSKPPLGSSAQDYFSKLMVIRSSIEEHARHMNTNSIWEYVDALWAVEQILNRIDTVGDINIQLINDKSAIRYYASVKDVMNILSRFFPLSSETELKEEHINELKEELLKRVDAMMIQYEELKTLYKPYTII